MSLIVHTKSDQIRLPVPRQHDSWAMLFIHRWYW